VALCERCGEEIAVANDLDLAGDVDRRRHLVTVAGSRRSLTATHWQIFILLHRHYRDVVYNDRIHAELSEGRDRPSAELIREHTRQLRKVLAGSRYQIVDYRGLGYGLIVADTSDASARRRPGHPTGNIRNHGDTSPHPRSYPRSVKLTTISTCRLPHCEHTGRSHQSRTDVSAPYCCCELGGARLDLVSAAPAPDDQPTASR
jgi:DNA-binding winged helix-turn-helix (wHTH) protein